MWKLFSALRTFGQERQLHTIHAISIGKRYFLSEAFQCKSVWEKRLQAPVIQNANLDELFQKLDEEFNHFGRANAVDIDVFVNAVRNESYAHELEDLIYKSQLSVHSTKPLPSTRHAAIRYFLDTEQYETLLRILNKRLVYGVFPDSYCFCLILDTFIKKKRIAEAARVSSMQILRGDWSNPLVTSLALYACHVYVQNPVPWNVQIEEKSSKIEDKAQVEYIRYPYFDDSCHVRDLQLLVGRTLTAIGASMRDAVGQTHLLVGLSLSTKWGEAASFLEQLSRTAGKPRIFRAGVKTFEKELDGNNGPDLKLRERLRRLLQELCNQGLVTDADLHDAVVSKVKQTVAREEENIISVQEALYRQWESTREQLLTEGAEALRKSENASVTTQGEGQFIQEELDLFFFGSDGKNNLLNKQGVSKQEAESEEMSKEKEGFSKT